MNTESPRPAERVFVERLRREVEDWQKEGLLHPDQAQAILARYGLVPGETPRTLHRSRMVSVLAVLGVILVGVGVILLIGANWQYMSNLPRLVILILATVGCYHAGYVMAYRSQKYPKVGAALLLLGSMLWGASIFLVRQMYHLGGEGGEVRAVFYWFIGVLPLAYILLSPLHMALSLVVGSIWLSMIVGTESFGGFRAYLIIALPLGIALYGLSRLHSKWSAGRQLETPYRWFGLAYAFGALYAFSFRGYWGVRHLDYCEMYAARGGYWIALAAILAAGLATILVLLITEARRDKVSVYESLALLFLFLVSIGTIALEYSWSGTAAPDSMHQPQFSLLTMALFNLFLFAAAIALIALGWLRNQPGLANLGIFVFYLQVLTRYFDLLGNMLSGGLMFVGAGLLLVLGGVLLERSRRRLLHAMAQRGAA